MHAASNIQLLKNFFFKGLRYWFESKPKFGTIKVNYDDSASGDNGLAGCGGVIRDHFGFGQFHYG